MRNTSLIRRKSLFSFLVVGLTLSLGTQASGQLNPTRSIANLRAAAERGGGRCYVRDLGGGKQRLYLNTGSQRALSAVCQAAGAGKDILQICHINKPGLMHTLGSFNGRNPHFQTPDGFRTWRLNEWGGVYHSNRQIYSAFIQLTPTESNRLQQLFAEARRTQQTTPKRTIPAAWARGNCASIWTNLPVGDNGESLGQLVGIGSNGSPHGLQQALETRANQRVFAIGVFGPAIPNFGQNPGQNVVTFR